MKNHRSISQRLSRAKSAEAKREVLQEWTLYWHKEQLGLLLELKAAVIDNDYHRTCQSINQLQAVTEKKFAALPKVFETLTSK